jgi:enediyne biosynthesis protein E4
LALKCPHVEIQDFNNDGLPDLLVSIVKFASGQPHPIIFRNTGITNGLPKFVCDGWNVNDFPSADDLGQSNKDFYAKMLANHKITYTAPAPTADFDNDGKLDMFYPSWWTEQKSMLLKNETPGGKWLQVVVVGDGVKLNRQGIGARIKLYKAGQLGDPTALLGCKEMAIGFGYVSGQPAIAHFGLGEKEVVDVEVTLPHGRGRWERKHVRADQRVTIE